MDHNYSVINLKISLLNFFSITDKLKTLVHTKSNYITEIINMELVNFIRNFKIKYKHIDEVEPCKDSLTAMAFVI